MPSLMSLEGPKLGAIQSSPFRITHSRARGMELHGLGVVQPTPYSITHSRARGMELHGSDIINWPLIAASPWLLAVGFAVGGYLAYKHLSPWAMIWGENKSGQSREKALHGRRRRR